MNRTIKARIIKAIKELNLTEEELKVVTVGNLKKISSLANVDMYYVMHYLRFER